MYFSREEGQQLGPDQRALYRDVMLENYKHVASLGLPFPKPELISQLEQGEELWVLGLMGAEEPEALSSCRTGSEIGTEKELSTVSQTCSEEVKTLESISRRFSRHNPQISELQEAWDHENKQGHLGNSAGQSLKKLHPHETVFRKETAMCRERPPGKTTQECGAFDGNLNLNQNVVRLQRNKTGERAFKCDICSKTFKYSSDLSRHHKSHSGAKPYECDQCGRAFTHSSSLILHHRVHTGIKPFKCNECGKTFVRKAILSDHHRIHTGEKPFQCNKCGKTFGQKSNLRIHLRTHSGEKSHECNEYQKLYTKSTLNICQRIQGRRKPC